jgi:hypothetical protein
MKHAPYSLLGLASCQPLQQQYNNDITPLTAGSSRWTAAGLQLWLLPPLLLPPLLLLPLLHATLLSPVVLPQKQNM